MNARLLGIAAFAVSPLAQAASDKALNTAWLVLASVLVFFMQAGFALLESKYADKPPFALNEFLGEVAAATERKLEPLLLSWRQRMGVAAPSQAGADSQARHTFEALSRVLLNELEAELAPRKPL